MFKDAADLEVYVKSFYLEVTDSRIDANHWDLLCTRCRITRGFQVTRRIATGLVGEYRSFRQDLTAPETYEFRCPVCRSFKQWIVYKLQKIEKVEGKPCTVTRYYRVTSLPSEGIDDIEELPDSPVSLRTAYREAIRAMDANANLAAAAMFRRALQVITRDILGATPGNLANELRELTGKTYNGVTLKSQFGDNGYIIKEVGNQGAHPDADPDLLDFTSEDARDLQRIFMELVSELFVVPAAIEKAKENFLARRKVVVPPSTK